MVETERIVEKRRTKSQGEYDQTLERLVGKRIFVPTSNQIVRQWTCIQRIEVIVVEQPVLGRGGFVSFFGGRGINSQ